MNVGKINSCPLLNVGKIALSHNKEIENKINSIDGDIVKQNIALGMLSSNQAAILC